MEEIVRDTREEVHADLRALGFAPAPTALSEDGWIRATGTHVDCVSGGAIVGGRYKAVTLLGGQLAAPGKGGQ